MYQSLEEQDNHPQATSIRKEPLMKNWKVEHRNFPSWNGCQAHHKSMERENAPLFINKDKELRILSGC